MNDFNKQNLKEFGKVLAIGLPAFIAIITFAGVLNGITYGLEGFYGWVAGLNLGVEGYLIYKLYKKLFKKED